MKISARASSSGKGIKSIMVGMLPSLQTTLPACGEGSTEVKVMGHSVNWEPPACGVYSVDANIPKLFIPKVTPSYIRANARQMNMLIGMSLNVEVELTHADGSVILSSGTDVSVMIKGD